MAFPRKEFGASALVSSLGLALASLIFTAQQSVSHPPAELGKPPHISFTLNTVARTTEAADALDVLTSATPVIERVGTADKQNRVAQFIADEWKVGYDYAITVVHAAFRAADRYNLDPIMLLAIAGKESSFRHIQSSNPNNTYGIMQVIGRLHKDKFEDGVVRATDVTENIDLGAQVVREYLDIEKGNERRALMRYNGSERKEAYSKAVSRLKEKLWRVMTRPAA